MADMKEKVFLFKVSLKLGKQLVYRELELKGSSSLHEFAKSITGAFNFKLDHAFGFYSNIKDMYESKEVYTCFKDDGGPGIQRREKSVKNSFIHEVFQASKQMLFLFDYGDEWHFTVECRRILEAEVGKVYPVVTKEHGEPPSQYPSDEELSDEECSDEEEEN